MKSFERWIIYPVLVIAIVIGLGKHPKESDGESRRSAPRDGNTIQARAFEVVDEHGIRRASLGVESGGSRLTLHDERGRDLVHLFASDDQSFLAIRGEEDHWSAWCGTTEDGGTTLNLWDRARGRFGFQVRVKDETTVVLHGEEGAPGIVLQILGEQPPTLEIQDSEGVRIWTTEGERVERR